MLKNTHPLLQVKELCINFKKPPQCIKAIQGVGFHLNKGETVALVGESGCGKSVTAQAILQLLDPSAEIKGNILFEGEDLLIKPEKEMQRIRGKKIGMIFQDPSTSLNPTMKVGHQITEGIRFQEKISASAAREKTLTLLKELEMGDPEMRYNAYPFQLSGGMRQRIMIAIALSCSPQLLIADEPTTALDVTVQAQILRLIQTFQQKYQMSLLLITHDLSIVAGLCDRVVMMQSGKVIESGCTEQIFADPKHPYTKSFLQSQRNMQWIPLS